MSESFNKMILERIGNPEQAARLVEKLFTVTEPGVVFSAPTSAGEYTVITASEVRVGMGFGFGGGGGSGPQPESGTQAASASPGAESPAGFGGGGGGGGASAARPVAVISAGPEGVRVEPVVDATKIALALFTAVGAMFLMFRDMRRASKG